MAPPERMDGPAMKGGFQSLHRIPRYPRRKRRCWPRQTVPSGLALSHTPDSRWKRAAGAFGAFCPALCVPNEKASAKPRNACHSNFMAQNLANPILNVRLFSADDGFVLFDVSKVGRRAMMSRTRSPSAATKLGLVREKNEPNPAILATRGHLSCLNRA